MGWRIGDLAYGFLVLSFIVSGLTAVLLAIESDMNISTALTTDLKEIEGDLGDNEEFIRQSSLQVDNLTSLTVEENQELETRASSEAGVFNLFSKNIAINFFKKLSEKLGVPGLLITFITLLIIATVTILTTRFFMGSGRA